MLQLVSSIANQTFKADAVSESAKNSFSERLSALARSNYVVSRSGWTTTPFTELVDKTLEAFGNRVVAAGPNLLLQPELCFDLGLVLHELATNSVKYGTLGKNEGTISLKWASHEESNGSRIFRWIGMIFCLQPKLQQEPGSAQSS